MEKKKDVVREYIKSLNDEDFKSVYSKLTQRISGDLGEALVFMEKNNEMKKYFHSTSADDYYDKIDKAESVIQIEMKKRTR